MKIEKILQDYDYYSNKMVAEDQFNDLESFVAAIGANLDIDFIYKNQKWHLGPNKDGYMLSNNQGSWIKEFLRIEDILDFKIDDTRIKKAYSEFKVILVWVIKG